MTIAMYQSNILAPHRRRRYGLLEAADVTRVSPDETQRWVAGVDAVQFNIDLHNVDLSACDPPTSGFFAYADSTEEPVEFRAFTSVATARWSLLCGPEASDARVVSMADEHEASLPGVVDRELISGSVSGNTAGSLSQTAVLTNPSGSVSGASLVGYAESLAAWESVIMVPSTLFAGASDVLTLDGSVWRTATGNTVVPHTADTRVYVIPAPVTVLLTTPETSTWVDRSTNRVDATSTVIGLVQCSPDVKMFNPS